MTDSGKRERNGNPSETKGKLESDTDALFALPLTEFIAARNALASRLKQDGRVAEADRVKALVKPSISAWAVNQLYWKHRQQFDRLIAAGQRFRQAQASQLAGETSDLRGPIEARREALSDLSHLAVALLRDTGHNPTSEVMRRIATTLEAMSAYASLPETVPPGHLTSDLDAPGFDLLAALIPGAGTAERREEHVSVSPSQKESSAANETRQARIARAKVSLQNAERLLNQVRGRAQEVEIALKKANAVSKEAERRKREASERFQKASVVLEEAMHHSQSVAAEAEQARRAVEDAEHTVEKLSRELRLLHPPPHARG